MTATTTKGDTMHEMNDWDALDILDEAIHRETEEPGQGGSVLYTEDDPSLVAERKG